MSDTPRTDAAWKPDGGDGYPTVDVDLARQLERELNKANGRIKRLEEAGDKMAAWLLDPRNLGGGSSMASQWHKAKEAKL